MKNILFIASICGFSTMVMAQTSVPVDNCETSMECTHGSARCSATGYITKCGLIPSGRNVRFCQSQDSNGLSAFRFLCCDKNGNAASFDSQSSTSDLPSINEECAL